MPNVNMLSTIRTNRMECQTRHQRPGLVVCFIIPRHSESFAEEFVGELSILGESIGSSYDGEVHPAVVY